MGWGFTGIEGAIREWVWEYGQVVPTQEWLLSDYDTWHKNPHYTGKPGRHPEDPYEEETFLFSDGTPVIEDAYAGLPRRGRNDL